MKLQDFKDKIKKEGLRLTQSRLEIFKALMNSPVPLTAKEVYEQLLAKKSTQTDQASVYRNLSLFSELQVVHQFQNGKFKNCSHDKTIDDEHQHIHILNSCTSCKAISEIPHHSKDTCKAAKRFTSDISSLKSIKEIVIYGLCKNCSS